MAYKSYIPHMIYRGAAFGLQGGILVWIILLLQQSVAAHNDKLGVVHHITFGPLALMSLGKREVKDAFIAHFQFEDGLLLYFAGWLLVGIIAAFAARWLLTLGIRQRTDLSPPTGTSSTD